MPTEILDLEFSPPPRRSRIILGAKIARLPAWLPGSGKVLFVCDPVVESLHGRSLPARFPRITLPRGEKRKTQDSVRRLYLSFLDHGLDRSSLVVAVGGGIVCDLAGFAAATFMRGLPFAFVPTTLLAQVDAAIGGKNGSNFLGYKNLIGTTAQPRFVFSSPEFLETLPRREWTCGLAEVIKAAAVADIELFRFLEKNADRLLERDREAVRCAVAAAVRVKTDIVVADELEAGRRRVLNFGHTLGHALERASGIRHGEAVSIGMAAAARLSVRRSGLAERDADRLIRLIERFDLPVRPGRAWPDIRQALLQDKKKAGNRVDLVLLERLGKAVVAGVRREEMERGFHDLCQRG
ncbi:MAG TPA: 3-dehydroquinate synthase [Candidatus Aminicenantes bacterium]|nr:3-dehydroquinate synthase [Candidatus Aminicenantes bacterium]